MLRSQVVPQHMDPLEVAPIEDDAIEAVARAIQLRGATVPAVFFLEANRGVGQPGRPGHAPLRPGHPRRLRGDDPGARSLLADDDGIERLIDRLEELEAESGLDA